MLRHPGEEPKRPVGEGREGLETGVRFLCFCFLSRACATRTLRRLDRDWTFGYFELLGDVVAQQRIRSQRHEVRADVGVFVESIVHHADRSHHLLE